MFNSIRAMMREPLAHFLLGGVGLFLLFNLVSDSDWREEEAIVVTTGQIEHMVSVFRRTRQRGPSQQELRGLIDSFIEEEVLYREAVAIGLDKNDTIVRRRLRQKMEFLLDDFTIIEPAAEDLQAFLDKNPGRFRSDAIISFKQIYLNESSRDKVEDLLDQLQSGALPSPDELSESYLLPYRFDDATEAVVSAQFGEQFKTTLFDLDVERWTGPVDSPFGIHLIRIEKIIAGRVPSLTEIRKEVEREWLSDFRRTSQQEILERMRAKYAISVEAADDLQQ